VLLIACFFGMALFAIAMLLAAAQGLDRRLGSHLRLRAWHHAYLGVMLLLVSYLWGGVGLRAIAAVLLVDDGFQHLLQAVTGDLWFRSPLHYFWSKLYDRYEWMRVAASWLDRRFGTGR
jgi:hypothetical protein